MSARERAHALILGIEGGLVDDKRDPGGITNHGISLRFAVGVGDLDLDGRLDLDVDGDGDVDRDDIIKLSPEDSRHAFDAYFWGPLRCDGLGPVGLLVADTGFNQGRGPAVALLQQALGVVVDGKLGPKTMAAVMRVRAPALCQEYTARRQVRYAGTRNFEIYGLGWTRRAIGMLSQVLA